MHHSVRCSQQYLTYQSYFHWEALLSYGQLLPTGQRIESGEIWADESKVAEFTVVGHKRICRFAPVDVQTLTIKITASRTEPTLRLLEVYQ